MPKPQKTRNSGQWTESRYRSFVRSALRRAWTRWGPNQEAKRLARIERGVYLCAGYNRPEHAVPASVRKDGKRVNNVFTDHIQPVGAHETWDKTIARMFVEVDALQVLCKECHDAKTKDERQANKKARTG